MPPTVARHSRDREATFGRGAGGVDRGYKLHAVRGRGSLPLVRRVAPLDEDERPVAVAMMADPGPMGPGGYILADADYDSDDLYTAAAEAGHQLLAPRRYGPGRGVGHRSQSPPRLRGIGPMERPSRFGRAVHADRRSIEGYFGNLRGFGGGLTCLPPWVRGLRRVTLFVTAKLIVRVVRDLCLRREAA
jgi:hypothetical protein